MSIKNTADSYGSIAKWLQPSRCRFAVDEVSTS